MLARFTEDAAKFIAWLYKARDKVERIVKDYERLRKKVDEAKGEGVFNRPETLTFGRVAGSSSKGGSSGESCEETEGLITLSGTGATADTATWSRENDAVPVAIAIETRDHYDETVHKLYHFTRIEKRDSCGNTYDISAETRVTTDTAETCDTTSPSPAFGF